MRTMRMGPLEVCVTGGDDSDGGGNGPVIVLLHGFGAPGNDLVPLSGALDVPANVRWVFPAAPLELASPGGFGMDSRAWWLIDMIALERAMISGEMRDLSKQTPEGLSEARGQLLELLAAIETEMNPPKLVLGGFSQGAMLSMDVALHADRSLDGLVLMSGTLLCEDDWVEKMPARKGLPVFQSHGRNDPLLPFAMADKLREHLTSAGLDVRFVPFSGAHEIPPPALQGLEEFLRARLA